MSQLSGFLQGFPCALPEHLKSKLHTDWTGPLKKIPRSFSARGPRCRLEHPAGTCDGYRPWPPRLVEGEGVARWENTGASSILDIPALRNRRVTADDVYGKTWTCIQRNVGHSNFGQTGTVTLNWRELSMDQLAAGEDEHSPSALQKFSMRGWIKLSPGYTSRWLILVRREIPGAVKGDDTVAFYRSGYRPDHVDIYYNKSLLLTGGLHWE